jgi:hypothetical protein
MKRLIYVGQDDDISDLAGRLQSAAEGDEVALVVPQGALSFQSPLHLRLLRQLGAKHRKALAVVTPDSRLQAQAREAGLGAFSSVPAFESGVPVGPPPVLGQTGGGSSPGPRPPAPPGAGGLRASGWAPDELASAPWGRPAGSPFPGGAGVEALPPWARASRAPEGAPGTPGRAEFERGPVSRGSGAPGSGSRNGWPASGGTGDGPTSPGGPPPGAPPRPTGWEATGPAGLAVHDPFVAGGTATLVAPPPARPLAAATSERGAARPGPPPPPRRGGPWRPGMPLYLILAGIAVVGLLLYLALSPAAEVVITVAEQPLTVNPVIQGSAQPVPGGQANQIQTRVVSSSGSQQFTATATGTKTVPAAPATGQVVLSFAQGSPDYGSGATGTIPKGDQFQTSSNPPIVFQVTQDTYVTIPPHGGNSTPPIPVAAVSAGSSGNVAANAINSWPACSNPISCPYYPIVVSNPQATSGGTDPSQETVASSSDVQGWQNQVTQLCGQLTSKVQSDLAGKASPGKIAQAPDQGGETVSCGAAPDVTKVAPGDQMAKRSETVTVTASGQATVYSLSDIERVVYADLRASNNLPKGDSLASTKPALSNLDVIQAASDGTLSISVTGADFYRPAALNVTSLRDQLTGHNPSDVAGIVEKQLGDVKSVSISEHPFPLFYMPFFASNIHITEQYVAPPASSAAT